MGTPAAFGIEHRLTFPSTPETGILPPDGQLASEDGVGTFSVITSVGGAVDLAGGLVSAQPPKTLPGNFGVADFGCMVLVTGVIGGTCCNT